MNKLRVLFVCVHNSGRSQMAEAFLNSLGGTHFEAESGGLEPTSVNPRVAEVMNEVGIDISKNKADSVFEMLKQGRTYNYVITVCDETSSERCPLFPGKVKRIHWSFRDPASLSGTDEEIRTKTRQVRDEIKQAVEQFIKREPHLAWVK